MQRKKLKVLNLRREAERDLEKEIKIILREILMTDKTKEAKDHTAVVREEDMEILTEVIPMIDQEETTTEIETRIEEVMETEITEVVTIEIRTEAVATAIETRIEEVMEKETTEAETVVVTEEVTATEITAEIAMVAIEMAAAAALETEVVSTEMAEIITEEVLTETAHAKRECRYRSPQKLHSPHTSATYLTKQPKMILENFSKISV